MRDCVAIMAEGKNGKGFGSQGIETRPSFPEHISFSILNILRVGGIQALDVRLQTPDFPPQENRPLEVSS